MYPIRNSLKPVSASKPSSEYADSGHLGCDGLRYWRGRGGFPSIKMKAICSCEAAVTTYNTRAHGVTTQNTT
jgi:hypothetical protein